MSQQSTPIHFNLTSIAPNVQRPIKPLKATLSMHEIKQEKMTSMRIRTKSRRDRILWAKRLRIEGNQQSDDSHPQVPSDTQPHINWPHQIKQLDSSKASERKMALKCIRKALSRNVSIAVLREILLQYEALPKLLLKHLLNQTDTENQLESAWCITNLCCVSEDIESDSALSRMFFMVPHLVQYVQYANRSAHMITLGKQCLWALGNIAAESQNAREMLLRHGLLSTLLDHMYGNSQLMKIACWCLGNLVRRMPNQDVFVRDGCLERVIALLKVQLRKCFGVQVESGDGVSATMISVSGTSATTQQQKPFATPTPSSSPTQDSTLNAPLPSLQSLPPLSNLELFQNSSVIDLLWILAYNTSVDQFDLLNAHIRDLYACVSVILYHCPHWEIHVPCLRTIGNLFRGPNSVNTYILQHDEQLVPFLCSKLSTDIFSQDIKDCLYVLSNIAGGTEEHVHLVVDSQIPEILVRILMQDLVTLEAKREAVFTLTNICSDGRYLHQVMFELKGFEACIHMLGEVASHTELSLLLLNFIRFVFEYCASDSTTLKRRFVDCDGPNYLQHLHASQSQVSTISVDLYNAIANI